MSTVRYESVDGNQNRLEKSERKEEIMKIDLFDKLWTIFTILTLNFVVLFLVYYARVQTEEILQKVSDFFTQESKKSCGPLIVHDK